MKLRNTEFFGVYFMKDVGKEGVVKHSAMEEDIGYSTYRTERLEIRHLKNS